MNAARLALLVQARDPATLAYVASVIASSEGNAARAARHLGVTRVTVYRWTRRHPELQAALCLARQTEARA